MPSIPKQDLRMSSNRLWSTMSKAALKPKATNAVTSWDSYLSIYHPLTSRVAFPLRNSPNNYCGIWAANFGCTDDLEFE